MQNMNPPTVGKSTSPNYVFAIAAIALAVFGFFGLIPTVVIYLCGIIPFILGAAAVVVGLLGFVKARKDPTNYGGKIPAVIGAVVGLIVAVLPILYFVFVMVWIGMSGFGQKGRFF